MDLAVSFILVDKCFGRDLSLPALPSHSPDRMPPKSVVPGIGKRPVGRAAGKGSRKKAPLPFKFFLSKPNATAWVHEQLVAVNQARWLGYKGHRHLHLLVRRC